MSLNHFHYIGYPKLSITLWAMLFLDKTFTLVEWRGTCCRELEAEKDETLTTKL